MKEMSERLPQLSRREVEEMGRRDPVALEKARQAGQLSEVLAGRNPGVCPSCGRAYEQREAK